MYLKRFSALLLVLLCALMFGACGSSAQSPKAHIEPTPEPLPTPSVSGHPCSPEDEALQCILPPPVTRFSLSPSHVYAYGVDFAWGAPTAHEIHLTGRSFGASYFSHDGSKGWTQRPGLVASYHAARISTVGVWESTASRAGQGCAAGHADAVEAARQARAVGNTNRPIDFAIDFDASGPQVAEYFRCAHAVLGDRANAYGGYRPLQYLCGHHLVGHQNWQTYAWSGGAWLPASCAPLEQYLNGSAVDYDRAIAPDYGQWPAPGSTHRELQERLWQLYRQRIGVKALIQIRHEVLARHDCWHRRSKGCRAVKRKGDESHAHLRGIEASIRALHRKGVR